MGQIQSKTIIEAMTRNITFEYGAEQFITSDGIIIHGTSLEKYKIPDNLPNINGLRLCTEDDISDFMNNDNRITYINNKPLVVYSEYRTCDICSDYVNDKFYHVHYYIDSYEKITISDYDMCLECCNNEPELLKRYNAYLIDKTNNGFGNFLEWIPIYKDTEFNGILYNCNPESNNYGKYAIWTCDDHERIGINILDITLNELIEELEEYYNIWNKDYIEKSWDSYYNCPLMTIISIRELECHYE